jgi:hypothetical protein
VPSHIPLIVIHSSYQLLFHLALLLVPLSGQTRAAKRTAQTEAAKKIE